MVQLIALTLTTPISPLRKPRLALRSSPRPATNWEIGIFGLPQLSDEDAGETVLQGAH
jgi:hypothetical protein